jgi:hypothetical protein
MTARWSDEVLNKSEVEVTIGQGAEASFSAAALPTVQLAGQRKRIDVSNANIGANFTARDWPGCRSALGAPGRRVQRQVLIALQP